MKPGMLDGIVGMNESGKGFPTGNSKIKLSLVSKLLISE
jgi:hypothetical protein